MFSHSKDHYPLDKSPLWTSRVGPVSQEVKTTQLEDGLEYAFALEHDYPASSVDVEFDPDSGELNIEANDYHYEQYHSHKISLKIPYKVSADNIVVRVKEKRLTIVLKGVIVKPKSKKVSIPVI